MPTLNGTVIANKTAQTVVVALSRTMSHPKYQKIIKRTTRLAVHNQIEGVKVGDKVQIVKTRPYSKTKHFKLVKLVKLDKSSK